MGSAATTDARTPATRLIRPTALPRDARIALVAPAGPLTTEALERAVARVEAMGWTPLLGRNSRGRRGYLSGTDDERLADLQAAIDADDNDAIWCLRGGYGTMRIVDRVNWDPLLRRPRPLIGFSDNTALHLALQRRRLISFHGPHPAAEAFPHDSLSLLRRVLTDPRPAGELPGPLADAGVTTLVPGEAEGRLVGGNLVLLAAMIGTRWAPRARGAILFFEEVGESLYRLDRLLTQLRLSGTLRGVRGIAVGALSECPDAGDAPEEALASLLLDRLGDLGVPLAFGFPFGHEADNWTLPLGLRARLDADAGTLALLQGAVRRR